MSTDSRIPQLLLWDNIERRVDGAVLIVVPRKMAAKGMVNRIRAELGGMSPTLAPSGWTA